MTFKEKMLRTKQILRNTPPEHGQVIYGVIAFLNKQIADKNKKLQELNKEDPCSK